MPSANRVSLSTKNGRSGSQSERESQFSLILLEPGFGHGETKATCLWLKNLPLLMPTNIVEGRDDRIHKMPPSPERWKLRSRTFEGVANAMAAQWSGDALRGAAFRHTTAQHDKD